MNCVPDSAAAQHMGTYIERKLLAYNYRRRIWLSRHIFVRMGKFLAKLSLAHQLNWRYWESPIKRLCVKKNISPAQGEAVTSPCLAQRSSHLINADAQVSYTAPAVSLD
jgi:hypothetical protein